MNGWTDRLAVRVIRSAVTHAPDALCERLQEEWRAALAEQPGRLSRLRFACGCWWAALVIACDHTPVSAPVACPAPASAAIAVRVHRAPARPGRGIAVGARDEALCEINTTPLIDVMLVLLVTLIITLPVMTHAIRIDLPQAPPSRDPAPEIIDLDIDSDGTVVWNGTALANAAQLEEYLRAEARREPQPEIHLRADRRVKYDLVAHVLTSAQHSRIRKIGFADTAQFKDER